MNEHGSANDGNILLVANYESNVGYAWWLMENFWVEIARFFGARGRRCVLIYPRVNGVPPAIRDANITVIEHDYADRSLAALWRLRRLVRQHDIRSIYLTDKPYYALRYLWLRLSGVRRIVVHDHTPGERPRVTGLRRWIKSAIFWLRPLIVSHCVGVSRFVRDRMIDNGCLPPSRAAFVLNGIVPIPVAPGAREYVRREFNLPPQALVVISTGRATRYKGVDFIIRCAERIVHGERRDDVYFVHCGDGPDLPQFRQLVQQLRLERHFLFAGRRSDIPKLLPGCDIGIQASRGEAFSLSILEYLSAGLAALVPDNCGNGEAVSTDINGMLYKSGDIEDAVVRLRGLLDNPELRSRLGAAGKRSVDERFNIARANRELLEFLAPRL